MANHKSAIKRHRQSLKRRDNNRSARSEVRTTIKNATAAVAAGKKEEAAKLVNAAERAIAKAAAKGLYHKKNAARKISRLASRAAKAK